MERYQLAKIVEWAGTVDARKRLQKVAYILKVLGCPLDAEYILHRYGPYSEDVARLTDEMVQTDLLVETARSNPAGQQFSYRLSDRARSSLAEFGASARGRSLLQGLEPFESKARQLFQADLKELEYASTVLFFREKGHDWPRAVEEMCRFKGLTKGSPIANRAEALAREAVA
jgi:uncharacterized protein YwgA